MYELHTGNRNYSSWSLRPWLLLRELGIGFVEHRHRFAPGSNYAAFRAFSPTGTVPALVDGAVTVWESLAIVEYLAERHQGVWPADAAARAWARCAAAEMHAGFGALRSICSMNVGVTVRLHAVSPALARDVRRIGELWNEGLARLGGPFLAGAAFSAVDAFFAPVAFRVRGYGLVLEGATAAYPAHLLALPGMREWEADALAEDFREPGHEAEMLAAGVVITDRRVAPA
jgi:glutathione S-transferase